MKNLLQLKFQLAQTLLVATIFFLALQNCKKDEKPSQPIPAPFNHQVAFNYDYDISGMNDTLSDNVLTADIVLFHSDQMAMTWNTLKAEFLRADAAFRAAGVQLNLKKAVNVTFPEEWNNKLAYNLLDLPDSAVNPAFYDMYNTTTPTLTDTIEIAFEDFTHDEENKARTIFVIPLEGVKIVFAQKNPDETWKISNPVATGALSFPSYILQNRIPRKYRGIITMEQSSAVTLAHELGHKLINVSHEGLGISPAFSGSSIPGLLGYGGSTTIYGGQSGRWHQERLLLSPYLYKKNGTSITYNPDYAGNGSYDDGIYGTYIMP
ncbi:MAG: hypothetical protein ABF242_09475 [Flavobacteriales bacterium]